MGNAREAKKRFKCPRCGNARVIDYDDSFECPECKLEFEKEDFEGVENEEDLKNILSVQEKHEFLDAFRKEGESAEEFQKRLNDAFQDEEPE